MIFEKLKIYLIIAGVTLALGIATNAFTAYKFYNMGQDNVQAEWDKAKLANVKTKLDVKARQDEIKNAPIDTATTVRRLRNGSF